MLLTRHAKHGHFDLQSWPAGPFFPFTICHLDLSPPGRFAQRQLVVRVKNQNVRAWWSCRSAACVYFNLFAENYKRATFRVNRAVHRRRCSVISVSAVTDRHHCLPTFYTVSVFPSIFVLCRARPRPPPALPETPRRPALPLSSTWRNLETRSDTEKLPRWGRRKWDGIVLLKVCRTKRSIDISVLLRKCVNGGVASV